MAHKWKTDRKANVSERAVFSLGEPELAVSMIYLKLGHSLYSYYCDEFPIQIGIFHHIS